MKIIDNFLSERYITELESLIVNNSSFPWHISPITGFEEKNDVSFYLTHLVYSDGKKTSSSFDIIKSLLNKINVKKLIRIKVNLYYPTQKIEEHTPHIDYKTKNKAFILSLNTCDGFTRIKNKKVESIRNRGLIFDGAKLHNSSSCTNTKGRYNININYV